MLGEVFYKFLMMIKKVRTDIKFIISGDYNQLKPVNDRISIHTDYARDLIEVGVNVTASSKKKALCDESASGWPRGRGPLPVPVPCTECRTCVSRIIILSLFVLTRSILRCKTRKLPRRSGLSLFLLSIH